MLAFAAARVGDPATHDQAVPCGLIGPHPVAPPATFIEGQPAAMAGSLLGCTGLTGCGPVHPPAPAPVAIASGSLTVTIGGAPAARWSPSPDVTACGAFLGDTKFIAARTTFIG